MKTEREKMLAGELYDASDAELVAARKRSRDLCAALNASPEAAQDERRRLACTARQNGAGDVVAALLPEADRVEPLPCALRTD